MTAALSDVPHDRVAGAILITDGRVHDVPGEAAALGFAAPVHALITGHKNERDRRVVLMAAPQFGIVGQTQTVTFRVEDQGGGGGTAAVAVRRDGETIETRNVRVGASVSINVPIPHAGPNIIEIEAAPLEASSRRSTIARSSPSMGCATSFAFCSYRASRMRASAPGATC